MLSENSSWNKHHNVIDDTDKIILCLKERMTMLTDKMFYE